MSDAAVFALIAAIVPTIAAIVGAIMTLRKGTVIVDQGHTIEKKADVLIKKTDEVYVAANGNLLRLQGELAIERERNAGLQQVIETLIKVSQDAATKKIGDDMATIVVAKIDEAKAQATKKETGP